MNLENAKYQLCSQYQIDHFVDLKEFDPNQNGKLYNCLRRIRKTVFQDNERVVFVAVSPLTKSFADQPHDVISMLEKSLQHHDIPHFFLIVLTNIITMPHELEYVRAKYNPQEKLPITHQWIV